MGSCANTIGKTTTQFVVVVFGVVRQAATFATRKAMTPVAPDAPTRRTTPAGAGEEPATSAPWHHQSLADAFATLNSGAAGLSDAEALARQAIHGANELVEQHARRPLAILWEQFTNVMVLILIAAALLSLGLGKFLEAGAILAIVVLFAVLGFIQEYRAEQAIAALKKLAVPSVRAFRNGALCAISARDFMPGDVIALEAGNLVPADVRISESINLRIQEAALTGESEPVEKHTDAIGNADAALGDRKNMAYMGTTITYGRGSALVVATGMQTELGTIARLLQAVPHDATPLQQRLDAVGKQLAVAGIIVAVLILGIGLAMGEQFGEMILTAISVAVAVIPEGLPSVVTFTVARPHDAARPVPGPAGAERRGSAGLYGDRGNPVRAD
jgi:Ca2+-transporting ATPase